MSVKAVTHTVAFDSEGETTMSIEIPIPGTFGGISPELSTFQGRRLVKLAIWLEGRAAGDKITALLIKDGNNVLPAPLTGATIGNLIDTHADVEQENQAISLPPGRPFEIEFPANPSNPFFKRAVIPAGLVIQVDITKAVAADDVGVVNLAYDDFT